MKVGVAGTRLRHCAEGRGIEAVNAALHCLWPTRNSLFTNFRPTGQNLETWAEIVLDSLQVGSTRV